jgi:hypothetical protein
MRMTTPLLGAAIGGGIGLLKRDPAKYALWGAGIGFLVTLVGGAAVSVGGISVRVGADDDGPPEGMFRTWTGTQPVVVEGQTGPAIVGTPYSWY